MTTYFKLVKGATKIKSAPPKQKYLDPILLGTSNEEDFYEIVKGLDSRINDTAWTIVYKSLLVVHLMIRRVPKMLHCGTTLGTWSFLTLKTYVAPMAVRLET